MYRCPSSGVARISPPVVANGSAHRLNACFQAAEALFGRLVKAGLALVQKVIFADLHGCQLRHDDVGAERQTLFPSQRPHRLQGLVAAMLTSFRVMAHDSDHQESRAVGVGGGPTVGVVLSGERRALCGI